MGFDLFKRPPYRVSIVPSRTGKFEERADYPATSSSFAALLNDKSGGVVTWGTSDGGGIVPKEFHDEIFHVQTIYSTFDAFAALKTDGSVLIWGA